MAPIGLRVDKRIDIITAECVFGMNLFRDIFVGARDFFGGRSGAAQKVFRSAREIVLKELREEAYSIDANSVIGVSIQYTDIPGSGMTGSMLMVAASGTAVVVRDEKANVE